ncbi:glycosyltransferase family 2 protein [Marivirga harenae]|uniref:glycosyltransferase family 2 protein n=1 Tax=Marivirga harenae TaxID=2010992 RepID=UPI0026DEB3CE|nr:glycosyltransferase family 2 protein [Marivirga harenae]WKV10509.1 glycosyltransferase family 2 protein [Marivirga harenae]|tara:strand:+ start:469652 stop:470341 length:690 start_codon:yes stop_codon:yes gene_type:complete
MDSRIVVIIPAFNEENAVGKVVKAIPKDWVEEIVVVNNNSTDRTRQAAEREGALVLDQPIKGYGNACLKGIEFVKAKKEKVDIVVFLDADYSDYPEQLPDVVNPILDDGVDLVIGSRALGQREGGSMTFPQVFGNWLATRLIKLFYGYKFTDLGPFRAIRWERLMELEMKDKTFGWTVEMQVKAAKLKMKCTEVPMAYRNRIGKSKVSGTVYGTIMAGYKILYTIFKYL